MKRVLKITAAMLTLIFFLSSMAFAEKITQGTLKVVDKQGKAVGECPLKHTDVKADISGFITRVKVTQQFQNPYKDPIEAVYVFPLPQNAAVDSMVMKIGKRTVKGVIKKREEARKIYEDAKRQGKTAALLDQERPNIFTQSVANIMPGESINVEITYVETLEYNDGVYEFVFPMVVGPRYMPGQPAGKSGGGWARDTDQVPDASKISPPVAPPATRAGHDISVAVELNAGVPVRNIRSVLHKVNVKHEKGSSRAAVTLKQGDNIPNKDFILQYETAGTGIEDAVLTTGKDGEGYFTMILQPPSKPKVSQVTPKEMFFVIDASGSQMGWPIEKAKETMKYCIENMNPGDTFQLLSFSNNVEPCFKDPVPNSQKNREIAQRWLAEKAGGGGTEMMKAIDYSLGRARDPQRMRIVVFMTDGYVGNDMAILDAVKKKLGNARLFPFGTGNSVNRYLLEGMARMGRGEVEWVTLNRHGDQVAEKFQDKIGNPLLLDIDVDWGNAPVKDVYPKQIPDLFSGKPVIIKGRYTKPFEGEIVLKGMHANKPFARKIKINLPKNQPANSVLGVLWARTKIKDLMDKDLKGVQQGKPNKEIEQMITDLGLKFSLMTQFTSFVAVEEKVVNKDGKTVRVDVPVEMPDGVSHKGVFGDTSKEEAADSSPMGGGSTSSQPGRLYTAAPAAPTTEYSKRKVSVRRPPYKGNRSESDDGSRYNEGKKAAVSKIDPSLKGLAEKVKKEGKDGSLNLKNVQVKNGRVNLILTVTHISQKTLKALKEKGFIVGTYSKANNVMAGSLPVDKIDEIAKFSFVVKIEPRPATTADAGTDNTSANADASQLLIWSQAREAMENAMDSLNRIIGRA